MTIDGGGGLTPTSGEVEEHLRAGMIGPQRLDSLLPADSETAVVTFDATRTYLAAMIDLMSRHGQPLSLLTIAADSSDTLRRLGASGVRLIGVAIARWLRQETRAHDVIGRARIKGVHGVPCFIIVIPLMTEPFAVQFAERVRQAMTISAGENDRPWLTLSVGIASLSLDADCPDSIILHAEEALKSAQRYGGGRVWSHMDTLRRIMVRDRRSFHRE